MLRLPSHLIPAFCFCAVLFILPASCSTSENSSSVREEKARSHRIMKALGDSFHIGMTSLRGFRPKNRADLLCQHWELKDVEDASSDRLIWKNGNGDRIYQEIILFKDFTAVQNPRNNMKTGTWSMLSENGRDWLELNMQGEPPLQYSMPLLSSTSLLLRWRDGDSLYMKLHADGLVHESSRNDPFYIDNIRWMIRPAAPENETGIKKRVRDCIKFYELYYRDNIKRKKKEIIFAGLPDIFIWYNRGIGLPDRDEIDSSWINCFYNQEQALHAYDILKKLIVDHEFNWPKHSKGWEWETESVLEQMYDAME